MKKIRNYMCLVMLLFTLIFTFSLTTQAVEDNVFNYEIVDGQARIIEGSKIYNEYLIIPYQIDGYDVVEISDFAFMGCEIIKEVFIQDGIEKIGSKAFEGCFNLETVTIPESVVEIGDEAFNFCGSLTEINVDEDNEFYSNDYSGVLFDKEKTTLIQYMNGNVSTSYLIPDCVKVIGTYAFSCCANIENIVIPNNVVIIEKNAFAGCNYLESLIFLDGVTTIGDYAFADCSNLKSVTIPESVISIEDYAFSSCYNLEQAIISNGVVNIGEGVFDSCEKLVSVTIPKTVKTMGCGVFFGCESLKEINYCGTETEWNEIVIAELDEYIVRINVNYNYTEPPHTHSYTSTVTKEATCWREGETTYTCTCGDSYTEAIAKLDHEYRPWETKKNPTCTEPGLEWSYCLICDNDFEREIPAEGHNEYEYTRRATPAEAGAYVVACDKCWIEFSSISFGRPAEYKLSTTKYTYNGKAKTPKLTITTSDGKVLKKGVDYTVELPKDRTSVGTHTYRVVFMGDYLGETKVSYQILPGKTSSVSASQSTSSIKLTWKKVTGADGYRVYQYNSKTGKYKTLKTLTGTTYTVKNLKAGTSYKFAVKAYTKDSGETLWAASSKTITTCTKPATPTVKVTAGSGKATLSWSKVTGATGYVIYMEDSFGDFEKVTSTTKTSYTKKSLKKGKTYKFRVKAYKKVDGKYIYSGYKTYSVKVK